MSLTAKEIHKIAKVAKIALSDEEANTYAKEIGDTFDYLEILDEADTTDIAPTYHGLVDRVTPLRTDKSVSDDQQVKKMLEQAPSTHETLIEVPAILDNGEGGA